MFQIKNSNFLLRREHLIQKLRHSDYDTLTILESSIYFFFNIKNPQKQNTQKTNNKANLSSKVAFVCRVLLSGLVQVTLKNPKNPNLLLLLFEQGLRVVLFFLLILHSVQQAILLTFRNGVKD